jgi:hypothetical protein
MDSDKEEDNIDKSNESSSASLNSEELEMFSKVEEKLKKELSQEIDNSETENKDRTLYAYCSECQENIFIQYKESIVVNSNSFPVYLVWVHGKPFHGLLVRIDKNFVSRGERVVHLEFDPELSNHYG